MRPDERKAGPAQEPAPHQTTSNHEQDNADPPWEDLVGVFPRCGGCGARVLHASVRVCFDCTQAASGIGANKSGSKRFATALRVPATATGRRPHITVVGPGRCTACSFHVPTQGHRPGCDGTAPVYGDDHAVA
jgi:hypothetical protein